MTISFVRIDDRMIHGQTVTRWAKEYPCDGLVAVNNAAAGNTVLKQAYKAASDKTLQAVVKGLPPTMSANTKTVSSVPRFANA